MNLNILSTNVMLAQSKQWLTDPAVRAPIDRHALGQAVLAEIRKMHDRLVLQAERRRQYEAALARLTRIIAAADLRQERGALDAMSLDRKRSALHGLSEALWNDLVEDVDSLPFEDPRVQGRNRGRWY